MKIPIPKIILQQFHIPPEIKFAC